MRDRPSFFIRYAKRSFYGTFLSRIFGMLRDVLMAFFFGSSPEIAMFMLSYRFANLFRRLIGESSLHAGFIPHFESIRKQSEIKAVQFFRDLLFTLFVSVFILVGFLEIALAVFRKFQPEGSDFYNTLTLIMLMLPSLIFICLYALNSSFLQCLKVYFLPSFAPVLFNIVWIVSVFLLSKLEIEIAIMGLSIAIVFAFISQWIVTQVPCSIFFSQSLHWKKWFRPKIFSSEIRRLYKPLSLSVIGVGAVQINSALDPIFAKIADPSGPAYLWYAIRLQMLPLSLFSIALAGALLPSLSRVSDDQEYRSHLQMALRAAFALMALFTLGIFVLGTSGLNLIYGRGDFTQLATKESIYCLWGYGLGLIPATFVLLLANGFYAKKNYKIPMIGSILSVVTNVLLNSLFIFVLELNVASIALATSISSFCNCLFLISFMQIRLFQKRIWKSFSKSLFCSCFAAGVLVFLGYFIFDDPTIKLIQGKEEIFFSRAFGQQFKEFLIQAIAYFILIFVAAKAIQHRDLLNLIKKISHLPNRP